MSWMGDKDEEGQKDKVACCYDRDTENKRKQFCIGSWLLLETSRVFWPVMLHSHAWVYEGQFRQHDFVCTEVYSVCCQGNQLVENYNSLIL